MMQAGRCELKCDISLGRNSEGIVFPTGYYGFSA
jgi:hypothetical protein